MDRNEPEPVPIVAPVARQEGGELSTFKGSSLRAAAKTTGAAGSEPVCSIFNHQDVQGSREFWLRGFRRKNANDWREIARLALAALGKQRPT
jgi:hypothetical protein